MVFGAAVVTRGMIPINELLNRIRWDPEFARGRFELGYYDRVMGRIILVAVKDLSFPTDAPQTFRVSDPDGRIHRVPFHRVREIYKDGQRIWHRRQDAE